MTQTFRVNTMGPAITADLFAPCFRNPGKRHASLMLAPEEASITLRLDPNSKAYHQLVQKLPCEQGRTEHDLRLPIGRFRRTRMERSSPSALASPYRIFRSPNTVDNGAKPTSEGAAPMVDILNGKRDGEHGGFLHGDGQYPW